MLLPEQRQGSIYSHSVLCAVKANGTGHFCLLWEQAQTGN